jgi:hypothetical protein
MTLRSAMNFPSSEMKKPWPFPLKRPVSSNTETITTAARIGRDASAKTFVEVRDCSGEGGVLDSTGVGVVGVAAVAGVGVEEGGGSVVARAMEGFRSHETNAPRTRIKIKPIHRILPNDIAYWSPTQEKSASDNQGLLKVVQSAVAAKSPLASEGATYLDGHARTHHNASTAREILWKRLIPFGDSFEVARVLASL